MNILVSPLADNNYQQVPVMKTRSVAIVAYTGVEILQNMGTTPFSPPSEFCERLSVRLNREVRPDEISNALLLDMQAKFSNK